MTKLEGYLVPSQTHRTEIIVEGSRFITSVFFAETNKQARELIKSVRIAMPDASHHVYAFKIGYGNSVMEAMSDDGEPNRTAGPPTLSVLRGFDIGDTLIVTTRYFGGKKLGKGGLVRAYTQSAQTALESLETRIKASRLIIGLTVSYSLYNRLQRIIDSFDVHVTDENFAGDIMLRLDILEAQHDDFKAEIRDLSHDQVEIIVLSDND